MRKLMAAQLSGAGGWAKLLLYKRDGSPFWALVHVCPLQPPPLGLGSAAAAQQQQQPAQQQPAETSENSGAGGASCSSLHLLLVADVTSSRLKRLGKYVVGKVLGQGASGIVRVGKNPATGAAMARRVAPGCALPCMQHLACVLWCLTLAAHRMVCSFCRR